MQIAEFKQLVWNYYHGHKRQMPWRETNEPYKILVSEVMLQQTQVSRVLPKYKEFLTRFPSVKELAAAPLGEVLKAWSGLGYNRRAKYLWQTAGLIIKGYNGQFPETVGELSKLPGIGKNTAGAVLAYSFNQPIVFIETNIRSVFLHHFFPGKTEVNDVQLLPLIEKTLDYTNPREWYWALMDYGSYLKSIRPNPGRASKHHVKQAAFSGSKRELRGWVLKQLGQKSYSLTEIARLNADKRLKIVITDLLHEGLIRFSAGKFQL